MRAGLLKQDDIRMLADIGFIAVSRGFKEHALAIFEAVKVVRPKGEAGYLGMSMVDILDGNPGAAVEALSSAPRSVAVNTFLGIALVQSSDLEGGRQVLRSVINESPDTPFARIASDTLAFVKTAEAGA